MYIATRRIGLKGSSNHNAFVAANRNMSFPLLTTTNVCMEREGEKESQSVSQDVVQAEINQPTNWLA